MVQSEDMQDEGIWHAVAIIVGGCHDRMRVVLLLLVGGWDHLRILIKISSPQHQHLSSQNIGKRVGSLASMIVCCYWWSLSVMMVGVLGVLLAAMMMVCGYVGLVMLGVVWGAFYYWSSSATMVGVLNVIGHHRQCVQYVGVSMRNIR